MPADGHTFTPDFRAEAEAIVAKQQERRAQTFTGGVSWSGLTSPAPAVESVEAVQARLQRQHVEAMDWAKSPRGRFYGVVVELEELGWLEEAAALEAIYRQSLSPLNGPGVNTDAIGRAIRILNGISHSTAREGISALADLLARPLREAA